MAGPPGPSAAGAGRAAPGPCGPGAAPGTRRWGKEGSGGRGERSERPEPGTAGRVPLKELRGRAGAGGERCSPSVCGCAAGERRALPQLPQPWVGEMSRQSNLCYLMRAECMGSCTQDTAAALRLFQPEWWQGVKFGRFFDPGGVTIWLYKSLRFTAVINFCHLQWQPSPRTQSPDENRDKQGQVAKCMFFCQVWFKCVCFRWERAKNTAKLANSISASEL